MLKLVHIQEVPIDNNCPACAEQNHNNSLKTLMNRIQLNHASFDKF